MEQAAASAVLSFIKFSLAFNTAKCVAELILPYITIAASFAAIGTTHHFFVVTVELIYIISVFGLGIVVEISSHTHMSFLPSSLAENRHHSTLFSLYVLYLLSNEICNSIVNYFI
jgi:hypothetical protein